MRRWLIRFIGAPIGRLNTSEKELVERYVEADTEEAAKLVAYETHEHIISNQAFEQEEHRQLEWTDTYGEELSLEAVGRYGEP